MNVSEAIKKIGEELEQKLTEDENAYSWDIEISIKKKIIEDSNLQNTFSTSDLENIYWYEMFNDKYNLSNDIKIKMIYSLVNGFVDFANINLSLDLSIIK